MGWVEANNGLFVPGGDQASLGLAPGQRPLSVVKNGWTWDDPRKYPLNRYGSEMRYSSWEEMALDGWMRSGLTDSNFKFLGDAVEITFPAQSARLYKTCPPGDFDVVAHLTGPCGGASATHASMTGIALVDSSGTGVGGSMYSSSAGFYPWRVTTWAFAATAINVGETITPYLDGASYWMSLRKIGAKTYFRASGDQATWNAQAEENWTPTAFTPAYFGFCRFYTSGGTGPRLIIHRVMVVPGTWVP